MNCSKHTEKPAVAQCAECGAGVCAECAGKTKLLKEDFGVLCLDCYREKLDMMSEYYRQDKGKKLKRLIISVICYALGVFLALGALFTDTSDKLVIIIAAVLLCGFYTGLTWRKAAQEAHDEEELKNGVTYVVTDDGIKREDGLLMKIIFFIIGTAIGVVFTPVRIILDAVGISRDKKFLAAVEAEKNSAWA